MTSYGDKWLGDPSFLPVMEELNRRKAIVYTHPTAANCCVNLVSTQQPVMIEFGTDTTRTIADIIFSGNAQKFRDIRWIFSHAGGTMPILIDRFIRNPLLVPSAKATVPDGTLAELKRFYYDTAQTSNKAAMSALSALIPVSQILFGTDYPYRTSIDHVKGLREAGVFTDAADHGDRTRQRAEAAAAAGGVGRTSDLAAFYFQTAKQPSLRAEQTLHALLTAKRWGGIKVRRAFSAHRSIVRWPLIDTLPHLAATRVPGLPRANPAVLRKKGTGRPGAVAARQTSLQCEAKQCIRVRHHGRSREARHSPPLW